MIRLLTSLMILILVLTQGSAMASAVCRHQNLQDHVAARSSADRQVAAVPLAEEAAAAGQSKKGSPAGDASASWPAPLLPAQAAGLPPRIAEVLRPRPRSQAALPSQGPVPLLEPPSA